MCFSSGDTTRMPIKRPVQAQAPIDQTCESTHESYSVRSLHASQERIKQSPRATLLMAFRLEWHQEPTMPNLVLTTCAHHEARSALAFLQRTLYLSHESGTMLVKFLMNTTHRGCVDEVRPEGPSWPMAFNSRLCFFHRANS